ncbi:hypothetical protein PYW07_007229 [Mythimna separata]|uniref:NADH dehydrogenase [ubiquinone] flavoprotein 2, mitochondrial n=1 Tax=Mythimna separata TaxID=271217 RepID=A0AAD8DZS2_MYTSE|nr:hypothetical protein PYW07_007229 [Mythimna separata]
MSLLQRKILNLKTSLPNVIYSRKLYTTPHRFSELLLVHRDTKENNPKIPFQFTDANMKRIQALVQNYPAGSERSAISMVMDIVQRQIGWIPISAQHKVAELLSIPRIRVYEWVTFYSMCKRVYRGKFHVKICKCLPCMLRGSDVIVQAVEDATRCTVGGISGDSLFAVDLVECQGACANAPVIAIDDDYYEDLNVYDVYNIIQTLKCGLIPPAGPQNGRYAAEPICGLTSLLTCPPEPGHGLQSCFK